ncbi:TON1 Recruiting Motif 7 [Hibiscus trionum]|uniref:TON1 Recruiting Motif 7 n=1 Tax=Hibiscus trionum TaxID=183268 RepID=A0A9W7MT77_HIBTR|nr:TON1 Recruiting Motif 7 [Hibiscus trionum]
MGVNKEGGFFQLFDWTAKSRKKLFSSKSDFPECSKQGKRRDGNVPMTRIHLKDEDETGSRMSFKGSSDYSCASSVTDDDMYGAKPPNVVARLMGLDSLPTSSEPYSTPFFDTQSLRGAHFQKRNLNYHHAEQIVYSGDPFNKIKGGPLRNYADLKPHKMVSNPIEKFRTESLPPKAAKTIPITHHKLLSPIKSPGFFPTKDAAHIMEAAARILEPGPQVIARAKMPLVRSSSVPVKVRDFKEKMEAAQRKPPVRSSSMPVKEKSEAAHKTSRLTEMTRKPVESNAAKYLKGQSMNKSWNGSIETPSFQTSDMEEISPVLKSEGKSVSLAIQAKFNVQKREGLTSSSCRSLLGSKDESQVKSNESLMSQPSSLKSLRKKSSMPNASGALRLNNQKQNCIIDKDKLPSKPIGSNLHGRRVLPADSALGRHKRSVKTVGNSKTGPRRFSVGTVDSERVPYSSSKNPRKKRSIDRDFEFQKNQGVDSMLIDHAVTERSLGWVEDSKKKGMDVVSFTFTAPLTRSMETSTQIAEKNNGIRMDNRAKRLLLDTESMNMSSLGYNVIGGDALSILLERKLLELSNAVESSSKKPLSSGSALTSISFSQDPNLPSCDPRPLRSKHKFQGVDEMDECSSSTSHLKARQPSPVSILEPSFSTESCNSSDSMDSFSIDGSNRCSTQTPEVLRLSPLKKLRTLEADTELSDSASSISSGTVAKSNHNIVVMSDPLISVKWELEYVKLIVCNVELMFKDFAIGRAHEIINHGLFDQLESRRSDGEEGKVERKVLFDSVVECLNSKCRQYASGGRRTWAKGMNMMGRNKWLAEEVYKEISRWRAMGDCMVDELVDDDMGSRYGKWLDFEVDAFVLGVDIEEQMMKTLVDEMVADLALSLEM